MLREIIRNCVRVVLSTGIVKGVFLYKMPTAKSPVAVTSIAFETEEKAIKFYNICCRYMEKHNRNIKHNIDSPKFYPFKNFVV